MVTRKTFAPGREEQRDIKERISALTRDRENTTKEINSLNTQLAALQNQFEPLQKISNEAEKLAFKLTDQAFTPKEEALMKAYQLNQPKMDELSVTANKIKRELDRKNRDLSHINTQIEKLMNEKAVQDMMPHAQENLRQDSGVEWIKGDRYGKGKLLASDLLSREQAKQLEECVLSFLGNESVSNVSQKVSVQESKNTPGQYRVLVSEVAVAQAYANNQKMGGHSLATDTHFEEIKENYKKKSPRRE